METRTVEFFEEQIKKIDEKIKECFTSLQNDTILHLKKYSIDDSITSYSSENTGVAGMCYAIEKLEKLREFYANKIDKIESPTQRIIREKLEIWDIPEFPKDRPT